MSRSGYSGYSEDYDGPALSPWHGAVYQTFKGKRGQAFLREALATLDSMPEKRLIPDSLHDPVAGAYCTLGIVGASRGIDLKALECAEASEVAKAFGISHALAAEIMFENDEGGVWNGPDTPEARWSRMRAWIEAEILEGQPS